MARIIEMQICLGSSCFSRGNKDIVMYIKEYLKKNHLDDRVVFKGSRCMDKCSNGPNLMINGRMIEEISLANIEAIMVREFGNIK